MPDATKKVDSWMPLWIGDYLADTMHLTTELHGAYLLLLFAYWRNKGPLLDDDADLAAVVKATPERWAAELRPRLQRFFTMLPACNEHAQACWKHDRADQELTKAGVHKAKAVAKAKIAADARWNGKKDAAVGPVASTTGNPTSIAPSTAPSTAQAMLGQCPSPSPISTKETLVERRASRLPADWKLPPDWQNWAVAARPDLDINLTADRFSDFWHAKSGKDATKLDWQATWRNWVRAERAMPGINSAASETPFQRSMRERAEQMTGRRRPAGGEVIEMPAGLALPGGSS